jgi:hypothetical protein
MLARVHIPSSPVRERERGRKREGERERERNRGREREGEKERERKRGREREGEKEKEREWRRERERELEIKREGEKERKIHVSMKEDLMGVSGIPLHFFDQTFHRIPYANHIYLQLGAENFQLKKWIFFI